jgi:glycosyltransferase involved in cell wall biosynthesis
VVIAAYQAERYLDAALASVRSSELGSWECVVVDDGSTDGTAAVVAAHAGEDGRVRLVRQPNGGVSAARNRGLAELSPEVEWVNFLDSDDLLVPDGLVTLMGVAAQRPDAVGVSGWAELIDDAGEPVDPGAHRRVQTTRRRHRGLRVEMLDPEADATFASLAIHGTIWPPATAVLRRSVIDAVGGFDPALRSQEDWDLTLRMARHGPIAAVDRQVAWYRRHEANATRDLGRYLRTSAAVRAKTWRDPANTRAQKIAVLRSDARVHAWMLRRQVELVRRELAEHRWSAVGCGVTWSLYALIQLTLVAPRVPSPRLAAALASLDARTRSDRGRPSYLEVY